MAPSLACHLVAFPEPVSAALFRPGLNVPPAPRGQRSWSALTRPAGRWGHPRGACPRSPLAPARRSPQASASPAVSPEVLDLAPLPPSRGFWTLRTERVVALVTPQHPGPQGQGPRWAGSSQLGPTRIWGTRALSRGDPSSARSLAGALSLEAERSRVTRARRGQLIQPGAPTPPGAAGAAP